MRSLYVYSDNVHWSLHHAARISMAQHAPRRLLTFRTSGRIVPNTARPAAD